MYISLNSKTFIEKEKEIYKKYRKWYSVKNAGFKAFHDTIKYFKESKDYSLCLYD